MMRLTALEPAFDPDYGTITAPKKTLGRIGMRIQDVDVVELNEAFAAQALPVLEDLGLLEATNDKVNLNGVATMRIDFGQGVATVFERV